MKHFLSLILVWSVSILSGISQTLQSPDKFLGYPLGERFTPHYALVNYFRHAAEVSPRLMKLEQYGESFEGRPLLLAFIGSEANISRLEEIRKNNLRLAGMLNDQVADVKAPVIVWLSYNVHGNETSSSEASIKMLYELLNATNTLSKEYLKNTIVIIDPCMNPDGRDRYVNWYNQVMGKNPNPDPNAREHMEPWPGGRFNHYQFDLNRDWAWQTQVETQKRMVQYNRWMPQVHSDYHEQSYNSPYYFAPAAQPYHEVITPWQRDFQVVIGKNNAKYFDAKGWLYFTKEVFDLFYPSYGDTYPLYNGSIGMTFEQGGGGRAGTAVITADKDTLTLKSRIDHHYITGMSTLEMVSVNAERVLTEFKKYFDDTRMKGAGEYASFIVTEVASNKLIALRHLLDANKIDYGSATGTFTGYNYFTGKVETFSAANSLAISTYQPKGVLAKVLFEPRSKLIDSATYDITAWAIPYAFGLQTYAVKERVKLSVFKEEEKMDSLPASSYGYLIQYGSFEDAKFLSAIVKSGVRVRYAEMDFSFEGKKFKRGTLIILKKGNENQLAMLAAAAKKFEVKVTAISTGFMELGADFGSGKVHFISQPRVAMFTGNGVDPGSAGEVWFLFDQQLEYPITLINADEIDHINWKNFDVLIMPNGQYTLLSEKDGDKELKTWIQQGGKLIAMENAVYQMARTEWNIKIKRDEGEKKEEKPLTYAELKRFEESEHKGIMSNIAGAIYKIELDNSHPLAMGYPGYFYNLKKDGNMYEYMKDGWNVGIIKRDSYVSGFVGHNLRDKIQEGVSIGVQDYGRGSVIYLADNPIFRNFWENGKMLFSNAVFLVGK